ncbi:MAG: SPFH domain-containing protein [Candidatus Electryonea clarkiae]|nr:SPFH domain-containing protein [Candidatus Electryonea clarkiae]MDP8285627.1 SPFH domain-containing protein [Candidatus Electryonea clarkiae]
MIGLTALVVIFILAFSLLIATLSRVKRCPSDQVLVVYGKVGKGSDGESRSSQCIHGGTAFIWPLIQSYQFLSLSPMQIGINLRGALSLQNIRVDVPSVFTVGISTTLAIMSNAAERLLGLKHTQVEALAEEIILGQLRSVIATMRIEEINVDRDKFVQNITQSVETELKKIGLKLINVNITDIKDESGYIEALGKEAAARAINEAKIKVAEQERDGEVGRANAVRDQRVNVASANADAVTGENVAKVTEENSNAQRREKVAEAERLGYAAERTKQADAEREAFQAEQKAEDSRADMERARQRAEDVVPAEINKQKIEIAAEAEAEKLRREAKGEADAIFAKMEAQGRGAFEILEKTANGLKEIVNAAGNDPDRAVQLMIADKITDLTKIVGDTVQGLDLSNVVVWDNLGGGRDSGKTNTAEFVNGLWGTFPGLKNVLNMVGLDLPNWVMEDTQKHPATQATTATADTPAEVKKENMHSSETVDEES